MAELTKEQLQSIQNYKDEIITLETFVEMVRQSKGMYVGEIGNQGVVTMFREVFQNGIDEILRPQSPCNRIRVTFDEVSCTFIIEDNGRGIPFGHMERIFASQHTSSNYKKKKGQYTSGMNGVGAKIVNALSTKFIVESYVLGEARRIEFDNGKVWTKGEVKIANPNKKQGTIIMFTPAFDVLGGNITVGWQSIFHIVEMITPLTPVGSQVYFTAIQPDGKEVNQMIESTDGLMTFIYNMSASPIIKPIEFDMDDGDRRAHVIMTFDSSGDANEVITSFSNFCITSSESAHVVGFIDGVTNYFRDYMNKVFLATAGADKKKKKSIVVNGQDIKTGLRAVIDAAHLNPVFTGQAKEKLSNPDMKDFMIAITQTALDTWGKNNPAQLQKLCKYFKDIAELRTKSDEGRVKLSNQYKATFSGFPQKFKNANKVQKELFIVEGDSAAGSFVNYRHNDFQAVFPIRGKILNCYTEAEKKCLENAEVAGIVCIVSNGKDDKNYGKNFDSKKVPWEKIIFAGDADSGGKAINALLLRLFLRFFPKLIEEGRVYKTVPPLYCVKIGKEMKYFSDRIAYVKYVQKDFSKKNILTTLKGTKFSEREVGEFLYRNIDYTYEMNTIANRYHVEPELLELYLIHRNGKRSDMIKAMKQKYRFIEQSKIKGVDVITGSINLKVNTLFITDRLLKECQEIIKIMDSNDTHFYKINGEDKSVYEIMKAYEKSSPSGITRLKGLGEQSGEELAESVILPEGSRTLIRYTMSSARKEIEDIRIYENDKSKLLHMMTNITRFDIME